MLPKAAYSELPEGPIMPTGCCIFVVVNTPRVNSELPGTVCIKCQESYTSRTALMQPSFSGLFVTWAYLPGK